MTRQQEPKAVRNGTDSPKKAAPGGFNVSNTSSTDGSPAIGVDKLGVRKRFSASRVVPVVLLMIALTPLWILYGFVGYVLAMPSTVLSTRSLALLGGLLVLTCAELLLMDPSVINHLWLSWAMVGKAVSFAIALLVAQFQVHRIAMSCVDASRGYFHRSISPLELGGLVCAFGWVAWFWESVFLRSHLAFASSVLIYAFAVAYVALPVVVALSHAQLWIPARYSELERVEHEILSKNVKCKFQMMKVAGLGTVFVPCTKDSNDHPVETIVLIHGFAAGNALWACNLEAIAKHYHVYAVEWIGKGRSDRPTFASYAQEEADRIIVDALEDWRKELKLDKFILCGHSMGAMFATSFASRYPGHVQHLVLVSPCGVGQRPSSAAFKPLPIGIRIFRRLWQLRLTPMSVVRYAGPFGPLVLRAVVSVRVSLMPETSCVRRGDLEFDALAQYWYHNWALKPSGEVAMHTHLLPGAYAKKPLCDILTPERFKIPITFMYGGGPDWMESSHADKVAARFEGCINRVQVLKVPLAGHQVFMDNVDEFNRMLIAALRE